MDSPARSGAMPTVWVGVTIAVLYAARPAGADCLYVANSESDIVSVIDTETNELAAEIERHCDNGACHPDALAITPDARFLYVPNRGDRENPGDTVSVVATATNAVVATVNVGSGPYGIAITPDGAYAYVANFYSQGSVSVIDTARALADPATAVTHTIQVGATPGFVVIAPDGRFAYVSTLSGTLVVIDLSDDTVQTTVPANAFADAVTPDGAFLYGTNFTNDSARVIDTRRALTDPTHAVTKTISVGSAPRGLAITPDGGFAYVANCGGFCLTGEPSAASSISVIDTSTNTVVANLPLRATAGPADVAFTADGRLAYVAYAEASAVGVIDTTKVLADPAHAVVDEIGVAGPRPAALVIASVPGGCAGTGVACTGDCNDNGVVSINELITVVNVALGTAEVSTCPAGDANGNGTITISELIAAVNRALSGC